MNVVGGLENEGKEKRQDRRRERGTRRDEEGASGRADNGIMVQCNRFGVLLKDSEHYK